MMHQPELTVMLAFSHMVSQIVGVLQMSLSNSIESSDVSR